MVNNSININKTNNHISPHIIEHKNKIMTYGIGNQGPGLALKMSWFVVSPGVTI
jgi:hypothetical protein